MSPFILMGFTGLGAGLLVPALAIVAAKLGLCDPFSLTVAGKTWFFAPNFHVASANSVVRIETQTHGGPQHRGTGSTTVTTLHLAI